MTKRAWFISGASSGLGAEMARQLAARGDDVALAARRVDRLDALAQELRRPGVRVTTHELDVTDTDAVAGVLHAADRAHDGLDVVVVNAGIGGAARVGVGDLADSLAVVDTNVRGALAQAHVAMALFRARGVGHLVLVSSIAGDRGLPGRAAVYSMSKAALTSLGQSLQAEVQGSGIEVTVLRPGFIQTDLTKRTSGPHVTGLQRGVAAMLAGIDGRRRQPAVPMWWAPVSGVLRALPTRLLRRVRR